MLDVGANIGQYGQQLRGLGYKGLILSFEPDPKTHAKLVTASQADPLWHCYNTALGAAGGLEPFNIMAETAFNSFRVPTNQDTTRYENLNKIVETVMVKVERLDDVLPALAKDLGFSRVYLKMDTQGFDLEVFRGASGVHDRIEALQSELTVKRLYGQAVDWRDTLAEYEKAGFELAGLFQVNPGGSELVEFDCHMVHRAG